MKTNSTNENKTKNNTKTSFSSRCKRPETVVKLKNSAVYKKTGTRSKRSKTSCVRSVRNSIKRTLQKKLMAKFHNHASSRNTRLIKGPLTPASKNSSNVNAATVKKKCLNSIMAAFSKSRWSSQPHTLMNPCNTPNMMALSMNRWNGFTGCKRTLRKETKKNAVKQATSSMTSWTRAALWWVAVSGHTT